ncbi:MAG: hypothetical protein IT173_15195 [Acidobacteria bacterium]|nr:hypothetical protein [Acidobacteriota bacterium]
MKRILTLSFLFVFVCAGAASVVAQRARNIKPSKPNAANRFAEVHAYSDGSGVLVEWAMAAEANNAGFYVYRLDGTGSEIVLGDMVLSSGIQAGAKGTAPETYSFFDPNGTPGSVYYVKNYAFDGGSGRSATASVETVSDLNKISPSAANALNSRAGNTKQRPGLFKQNLSLPKMLAQEVLNNRPQADPGTHAWVVSQPGVRIGIRREGFYRVTRTELQNAGFNVSGDSSLWQLYREGVEQAILVGPNADYIDFWAKGVDTRETDLAMYFLVAGPSAGKRIDSRVARPVAGTVTTPSYSQVFQQKQRFNYLNQVLNGEAENYWGAVVVPTVDTTYNFTLTGVDFAAPTATIDVKFQGYSLFPVDQHSVQITLNGHVLPSTATGTGRNPFSKEFTIPTSYLAEGANSLVFRSVSPAGDFSLFDSVSIGFKRRFLASQNRVKFYTSNYRLSKLEGFSSANIRVFDMTAESSPVMWTNLNIIQDGPTYSVRMPSDRGRSMFAVEDSGLLQVASISANDPSNLKAPTNAANLVIITHANWLAQAQNWANYRIGQGFQVKVVDVSEVYDEFNYGDLNSLSIRDFLQYAENNWQTAPGYVLFLGDASYDSRNYEGLGYNNFVPTHMVDTIYTETGSDEFLADFNNDGLAEMAVGRITARTPQAVTNALAKVTAWEAAAPTLAARGALFVYDCYDASNDYDFKQYSTTLRNQLAVSTPVTMTGLCEPVTPPATPQSVLIDSINMGRLLVNFSGHGARGTWTSANPAYFSNNSVPSLTNANDLSIFTMLTCLNGYFMHVQYDSLSEALVGATNGGAVAAWASTGETTPTDQNAMAKRFYQQMNSGPIERLGDLVNDAKTVISGGSDVRLSWALIGDPMLKVRVATTGDRPTKKARPMFDLAGATP